MNIETQGLTMKAALDVLFHKARNRRLIIRRYQLLMRESERKLQPSVKEFMDYMTRKLKAEIPKLGRGLKKISASERARKYADKKKITKIVEQSMDWDEIRAEGQKILQPAELEVLLAGIDSVTKQRIRKQARVDPIGTQAITWAQAHTADLVVEITTATLEAIKDIIVIGIEAGKSIPAIATELRPIVGLHPQYATAVEKYYTSLIEEGIADAAKKADRYAGRLHRRRTQTIARTETAFGLTEGQRQGYGQMGVTKLERVEDPDAPDDDCRMNNGRVYSLAAASGVLPAHPNCGGSWVAVV